MATTAADRHLLFGLLALQNGLIDQGALVAAFQAWIRDKTRSLADQLVARGDLDADACAGLEAIVALHVKKHGDVERSLAAVPANRSTHASLAALGEPEIEATLARVAPTRNDQATDADDDHDPWRTTAGLSLGAATSDGQRFRLLRPHARGGLGEVFVALDAELHREVALKQILERHADDPVSRQRFVAEAEITGGLEHPGVVPVYGLGTYGGGRPYYAMRFIKGDSLKEAIDAFHQRRHGDSPSPRRGEGARRTGEGAGNTIASRDLELRKLLRRFLDVCNAIDYAHSRGVIHRDIKPANIILGKHGETLVVDWGLAKAVGRADPSVGEQTIAPSSSGSSETLPGSAMGTPAYMSPEQAGGDLDRLGPRSDVYSLGATLYCLLTGKPPFEGKDVGEILRRVQAGDVRAPREVDPALDKALEAVCLKAMATQPADRYAGCRALAEDIERWAADEPVSAWREPISRRLRRWANRNRTAVAAVAVALFAGVVGLSAVLAVQTQAKAEVTRALAGERDANRALAASNYELGRSKAAVQARYDLAVEAIQAFHTGVSEDFLLKQEQFKELRDRLLRSAQEFYGKLSALLGRETDPAARRALSATNFELADLTGKVGTNEDALKAHRGVLAAREALAAEPGADAAVTVDVGRSLIALARLLQSTGKTGEALAAYRRSEALLAGPAGTDPAARAALADGRSKLGGLLASTGQAADAMAAFRQARADQEALAAAPEAPAAAGRELADTVMRIGQLLSQTGKPSEAEAECRRAQEMYGKLAADNPAVTEFRDKLAYSHYLLGILLRQTGQPSGAAAEFRRALETYGKLAADNPAVTQFRSRMAGSHNGVGLLLQETGKPSEAEAEYRRALVIQNKLAADHPAVTEFRGTLALSHINLGSLLAETGKATDAEAEFRRALEIQQKLAADHPAVTQFRSMLAIGHSNLGILLRQSGKATEAEAEYRRALEIQEKLAADNAAVTEFRRILAGSHHNLGGWLSTMARSAEAAAEYRAAMAIYGKLAGDNPKVPDFRNGLATSHTVLSEALRRLGRPAEAKDACDRAIAIREALVKEVPKVPLYRSHLAYSFRRRGLARGDLGDPAGAAADARRAAALWEGLSSRMDAEWFETACCHAALAGLAGREGSGVSAAEAVTEADTAIVLIRKAIEMGYRAVNVYRTEDALDPLRSRDDFKLLVMDLAFPQQVISRSE
jgi:eukaryotic-like serine/threonine-protein kinase